METHELLSLIQETLADDMAVNAWCLDIFGKVPTVFLGMDEENPPDQDHYPVIMILDCRETRGRHSRARSWSVEIGVGIVQPEILAVPQRRIYSGFLQAETFRSLVESALLALRRPHKIDVSGDAGRGDDYPLYCSFTQITFEETITSRH